MKKDMESKGTLIIGASHAGVQAAASLRELGYEAPITLLEVSSHLPYQRPPLSKAYLKTDMDDQRLALRGEAFYKDKNIQLLLNRKVTFIDPVQKNVLVVSNDKNTEESFEYDQLIIATGASARKLPCKDAHELSGVLVVRDLDDAKALKPALEFAQEIAIVGAGFIGLEVAATARAMKKNVMVIDHGPRILRRIFPEVLSDYIQKKHESAGVQFFFETDVENISPTEKGGHKLQLSGKRALEADLVIVGIGAEINDDLGILAGLECHNGIVVDIAGRTSNHNIFACGDCTTYKKSDDDYEHIESIQNAVDQAKCVAAAICEKEIPLRVAPWFWSDQADIKLQMVGDSLDYDDVIIRGDMNSDKFSLLYFSGEQLTRVDSINNPADHMAARKLVTQGAHIPKAIAADVSVRMKEFIELPKPQRIGELQP